MLWPCPSLIFLISQFSLLYFNIRRSLWCLRHCWALKRTRSSSAHRQQQIMEFSRQGDSILLAPINRRKDFTRHTAPFRQSVDTGVLPPPPMYGSKQSSELLVSKASLVHAPRKHVKLHQMLLTSCINCSSSRNCRFFSFYHMFTLKQWDIWRWSCYPCICLPWSQRYNCNFSK